MMNRHLTIGSFLILAASAALPVAFAQTGLINTIAGGGTGGVGGPATNAQLNGPLGIRVDSSDDLYIADNGSNRVLRVDSATGVLTLVAGNGAAASSGDFGPATQASVYSPRDIAFDAAGDLFIAEMGGHNIRRVDAATGIITTVVGNGTAGFSGDGGPASSAQLNLPTGVVFDASGNMYIADSGNKRIRRVDALTGVITTVAGNGTTGVSPDGVLATAASFIPPIGLGLDQSGAMLITDYGAARIRRVDPSTGILTTIAGNGSAIFTGDGVLATNAGIGNTAGAAITDPAGNIYFADATGRIRRVDAATQTITTVAGNGSGVNGTCSSGGGSSSTCTGLPFVGDGGPATNATLNGPAAVALTQNGNLLLSDWIDCRVRRVYLPSPLAYTNTTVSANITGSTVNIIAGVSAIGGSAIPTGTVQLIAKIPGNYSGTNLGTYSLGPVGITVFSYSPASSIAGLQISAYYTGDQMFNGSGSPPAPITNLPTPTVTVSSSQNPVAVNAPVTLTVTVTPSGSTPTGTVQIWNGTSWLPTATLVNGSTQVTTTFATPGTFNLGAMYSGDSNYARSLSGNVMLLTVQPSATTVSISSSANPSAFGSAVTFTAAISPSSATGTVQFLDGTTVLGTTPITSGGATFVTSNLTAGSHSIQAVYSGDASNSGASSPVLTQVVSNAQNPTTVTFTAGQNPTSPGFQNTYLVQVTSTAGGTPTGTVQLLDNSNLLATGTLVSGSAQIQVALNSTGTHPLTAVYSGDASFAGSTSSVLNEVVKLSSSGTISVDINPVTAGSTATFTVTIYQSGPTGTVQLLEYPTPSSSPITLMTVPLNGQTAVFPISTLSAGAHNIAAAYSGDATYLGFGTAYIVEVVRTATSTTLSAPSSSSTYSQPVTFTASVSPAAASGTVQFLDGATPLGTATLNGGAASITVSTLTAGPHSVKAVYSGDSGDAGSTSAVWTQNVSKAGATVSAASSLNPANSGQAISFSASVSPASATGNIQFLDGATTLATVALSNGAASFSTESLTAGSHSITAVYSGDANYAGASSAAISQVVKAISTVTIQSSAATAPYGQAVQFTATLSPPSATGSIQFVDTGASLGTAAISNGAASITVSTLAVGSHSITAVYSGDGNDTAGASAAISQLITKDNTTTTLQASPAASSYGQAVQLTAAVLPSAATGTVQFLDGGIVVGTANVAGGVASLAVSTFAVGAHSLTAVYSGDGNDLSSTSAPVTITIVQATPTVTLASSLDPSLTGQSVTFTATVLPAAATGTIQFLDGTASLGTVALNAGVAILTTSTLTAGTHTITAKYSGNAGYTAASASLSQVVNVPPAPPTNLRANSAPGGQVNLNWNASKTPGVTYNVYSSTASNFVPSAANLIASGITATGYANTGLAPNTTYYYFVTAQSAVGESAPSNKASATTKPH